MKATLYTTNEKNVFAKKALFYNNEKSDNLCVVSVSKTPMCESFTGFGVAITGSSCYELSLMPENVRNDFLTDIYGGNGLNLSVARVSIGSSDYSPNVYSYCDKKDMELKSFSIEKDMEFIIPMLREAMAHKKDLKFFASPWSPPGWMKTSGTMYDGYMRSEYIDCYADYIIKFLKAYKEQGISIGAVTPQNEPETHHFGCMPACIWHPDTEAEFVSILRKKLNENGMNTQIWMYDHSFAGWTRVKSQLKDFPNLIDACDAIAFHYYDGTPEMAGELMKEFPNLKWHYTEGGPRLTDNYDVDWCKWGIVIGRSLNCGAESFTGWNLLLDEWGEPNVGPFWCGGLATLNSQSGEIEYSGQYHAFMHFSRFIKRGAKIYPVEISGDYQPMCYYSRNNHDFPIIGTAAVNKDGSHVLVLTNTNKNKVQMQYFYNEKWWYGELLPNSISTWVFG